MDIAGPMAPPWSTPRRSHSNSADAESPVQTGATAGAGIGQELVDATDANWPVPCFRTLSRRQATLTVNIPARRWAKPLHLLVDSTGSKSVAKANGRSKSMVSSTAELSVRSI